MQFDQIQLRETEMPELTGIMESEEYCPLEVKGGVSTKQGKVNILCVCRPSPARQALIDAGCKRIFRESSSKISLLSPIPPMLPR